LGINVFPAEFAHQRSRALSQDGNSNMKHLWTIARTTQSWTGASGLPHACGGKKRRGDFTALIDPISQMDEWTVSLPLTDWYGFW
jgi:hypothetical protein